MSEYQITNVQSKGLPILRSEPGASAPAVRDKYTNQVINLQGQTVQKTGPCVLPPKSSTGKENGKHEVCPVAWHGYSGWVSCFYIVEMATTCGGGTG